MSPARAFRQRFECPVAGNAELYNPATGTWSRTGSMTSPREGQPATLLNDGQVLMAGETADL